MPKFAGTSFGYSRDSIQVLNPLEAHVEEVIRKKRRMKATINFVGRKAFYKPSQEYIDYITTLKSKK